MSDKAAKDLPPAPEEVPAWLEDPPPRLQQIATLVGVSKMTVSRALRNGTSVDPKLRARIRRAAARLHYQPNPRLSLLISEARKSRETTSQETLAFIWTHPKGRSADSYFHDGFAAARRHAGEHGFKLDDLYVKDEALCGQVIARILRSRGIRGAVIAPPGHHSFLPHARQEWKNLCGVVIGHSPGDTGLPCIRHDTFSGMVLAVRQLRRLQYKRIGLVLAPARDMAAASLFRSAFLSFHPGGLHEADQLIYPSDTGGAKELERWMAKNRPDALITDFASPFPTREQILEALPRDAGLATLSWHRDQPQIAGIAHQRSVVAVKAIDLLARRLNHNQLGLDSLAPTILVPGAWVNGSSVRQRAGRNADSAAALHCV